MQKIFILLSGVNKNYSVTKPTKPARLNMLIKENIDTDIGLRLLRMKKPKDDNEKPSIVF